MRGDEFVLPRRIEPARGIEPKDVNSPGPRIAVQRCPVDVALRPRWNGAWTFLRLDCLWCWIQAGDMHDRFIEAERLEQERSSPNKLGKGGLVV